EIGDEELFKKFLERYRKVFQFEQNHPGEEISLSISGERVLFHVETHEVPYQADKSNMNEDEWRAAIKWIEKQEGDGPWVVSPGDDDQKSVSQEDEETLLRDAIESGDEAERERCEKKRCDKESTLLNKADLSQGGKSLPSIKFIESVNLNYKIKSRH
ncbi:GSCOCG00012756001-RA-CDS, partial [Cotesia congregata]